MRVLITRPAADAAQLAASLKARGHEVLVDPLVTVREEPGAAAALERSLPGVQAVLFTSPNGVRAFAATTRRRNPRVITVGDATTTAARTARFSEIESVEGDVESLATLVAGRLNPLGGALLLITGAEVGGDLARVLGSAGFSVRRVALYRAEPAQALNPKTAAALKGRTVDSAVFFSPGTAGLFARLVADAGLESACEQMTAVVLNSAVAAALKTLAWENLITARVPTQAALLEAFGEPPAAAKVDAEAPQGDSSVRRPEPSAPVPISAAGTPTPTPAAPLTAAPYIEPQITVRARPSRGRGSRMLAFGPLLFVLLLLLAAVATSPYWALSLAAYLPWVAPGDSGVVLAKVNEINERMDALDARVEKRLAEFNASAQAANATAGERVGKIEEETRKLESTLGEHGGHLEAADKKLDAIAAAAESANAAAGERSGKIEEEARKLGSTVVEFSAHVAALDKKLDSMTAGAESANAAASARAAGIEDATRKLDTRIGEETGKLRASLEEQSRTLGAGIAAQGDRLAALDKRADALAAGAERTNATAASLGQETQKLGAALAAQGDHLTALDKRADALAAGSDGMNATAASLGAQTKTLGDALKAQNDRLDSLSAAATSANAAAAGRETSLEEGARKIGETLKAQGDRLDGLSAAVDGANATAAAQKANLDDATQKLGVTLTGQADQLVALDKRLAAVSAAADGANASAASLGDDARKLGATVAGQGDRLTAIDKRLDTVAAAADTLGASTTSLGEDTRRVSSALIAQGGRLEVLDKRLQTVSTAADGANASTASLGDDARKLGTMLADQGGRLAALEKRLQAASPADIANMSAAAQTARTTNLEDQSHKLAEEAGKLSEDNRKLSAALAEQQDRLAKLETVATAPKDNGDLALTFAVSTLRLTLATSRPFATELQTAESLAQQRPDALASLRSLDERAPRGIPSLTALAFRLDGVVRDIRRAELVAKGAKDTGANSGILDSLQEAVMGRREDPTKIPEPSANMRALAAAEVALKSDDLGAAISAVKQLDAAAAPAAASWIQDAEARVAAEATMAALDASLAQRLRESGTPAAVKP
jgi:uroporphyrinogen-III synthase